MQNSTLDLSKTDLLDDAFAPSPISRTQLITLYDDEPYYADDVRGTVEIENEKKPLTLNEQIKLSRFNRQFDILIQKIRQYRQWNPYQLDNLTSFSTQFKSRIFYLKQSREYYAEIKHFLEDIALKLDEPCMIYEPTLSALLDEIGKCIGIFTHIQEAAITFTKNNTLESILALIRRDTIERITANYIAINSVSPNDGVHAHNDFMEHAIKLGINPTGYESFSALNDFYIGLANTKQEDFQWFENEFVKKYTPVTIINHLAEIIYSQVMGNISAWLHEINQTHADKISIANSDEITSRALTNLPQVCHSDSLLSTYFNSIDTNEYKSNTRGKNTPVFLYKNKDQTYEFTLKSLNEFKLALVNLFSEKLFKTKKIKTAQGEYTLLKKTSDLSYSSDMDGNIAAIAELKEIELPLKTLKEQCIPITQQLLEFYLRQGETDFSHCYLESIDLTKLKNEHKVDFQGASFKKLVALPTQYIALIKSRCEILQLNSAGEQAVNKQFISTLNATDQGILLFYAIDANLPNLISSLAEATPNSAIKNNKNEIPIEYAARCKQWECVKQLAKISWNSENAIRHDRVFHAAVIAKNIPVVRQLAKSGANVDYIDYKNGNTSLHSAVGAKNADLLRILLQNGASPSYTNWKNETPIQTAVNAGYWEGVKILAELKQDQQDKFRYGSALIHAAIKNKHTVVKSLLTAKASLVWYEKPTRNTALHYAVINKNVSMVRSLIAAGANAFKQNSMNKTPIQIALEHHDLPCLAMMIPDRCNTEDEKKIYGSVLYDAVSAGDIHWSTKLLQAGASVNITKHNSTMLHIAMQNQDAVIIQELVNAGANPFIPNEHGETPIQKALESENILLLKPMVVKSYEKLNPDPYFQLLFDAVKTNKLAQVTLLVECGIGQQRWHLDNGLSILDYAVSYLNPNMISILLPLGMHHPKSVHHAFKTTLKKGNWSCLAKFIGLLTYCNKRNAQEIFDDILNADNLSAIGQIRVTLLQAIIAHLLQFPNNKILIADAINMMKIIEKYPSDSASNNKALLENLGNYCRSNLKNSYYEKIRSIFFNENSLRFHMNQVIIQLDQDNKHTKQSQHNKSGLLTYG